MQTLTTEKMKELKKRNNVAVINVLSADQYREAHIPGSDNIPFDQDDFADKVEQRVGGKEEAVVVYCASEECNASPKAAKKLEAVGFTNVYDYEGGTKAWKEDGNSVESS
jgi:rhodanese-related sulfurtransferase